MRKNDNLITNFCIFDFLVSVCHCVNSNIFVDCCQEKKKNAQCRALESTLSVFKMGLIGFIAETRMRVLVTSK